MKATVTIYQDPEREIYRLAEILTKYRRAVAAWENGHGGSALKNNRTYWADIADEWIKKHVKEEQ